MRIHKGDTILVISGKDRGKRGKVLQALPKRDRILVEGVNMRKKHRKPKKEGEKGQIVSMPGPIDVSNVKLICPRCGKATRVRYKNLRGKKVRICKKCNQEI